MHTSVSQFVRNKRAHFLQIVLESASSLHERSTTNEIGLPDKRRSHLLVFSAGHPESLKHNIANQQHFIEQNPHLLKDLAYTLGARREHLAHRAFCVTDGTAPLRISPATRSKSAGQTVLVFTGQGAQWAGMAKQLWEDFDGFRRDIQDMDDILAGLPYPPSWQIQGKIEHVPIVLASTNSNLFSSYRGTTQERRRQPHQPSGILTAAVYSSSDRYRELVPHMGNCAGSCSGPLQR